MFHWVQCNSIGRMLEWLNWMLHTWSCCVRRSRTRTRRRRRGGGRRRNSLLQLNFHPHPHSPSPCEGKRSHLPLCLSRFVHKFRFFCLLWWYTCFLEQWPMWNCKYSGLAKDTGIHVWKPNVGNLFKHLGQSLQDLGKNSANRITWLMLRQAWLSSLDKDRCTFKKNLKSQWICCVCLNLKGSEVEDTPLH